VLSLNIEHFSEELVEDDLHMGTKMILKSYLLVFIMILLFFSSMELLGFHVLMNFFCNAAIFYISPQTLHHIKIKHFFVR